jgi:hypothetical protein
VWDSYAAPQLEVMQFLFVGSFAGNSSFKAVLAASSMLFTANYREWCPLITRQFISALRQDIRCGYELLHFIAVGG